MARHFVLAMPVPGSARYAETAEALRGWAPGLRTELPGTHHIHLRRLDGLRDAPGLARAIARELDGQAPVACRVRGLGADPDVRSARRVFADVEAPGLDRVQAAVLGVLADEGESVPRVPNHVMLAHLPAPADVRSFLRAHAETEFARGAIDRVAILEAMARPTGVAYREIASVTLPPIPEFRCTLHGLAHAEGAAAA
jgi:hypothetical protein